MQHDVLLSFDGIYTGLRILHTPGHTPDELALWDESERMLYVGDTLYEWEPIIFPTEGDIIQWFSTMDYLISFVRSKEETFKLSPTLSGRQSVMINSGHCTSMMPALEVLLEAKAFLQDVISGKERVKKRIKVGGIESVFFAREDGRFSLRCPKSLVDDARQRA